MKTLHFRKPGWGTTLFMLVCLTLLLLLGGWQHKRLGWKTALLNRIETGLSAPLTPLPATIDHPAAWEYRPVSVTGRFLHDKTMILHPRTHHDRPGGHVVTLFQPAEGLPVFVNRGWLPQEQQEFPRPAGDVTLTALIGKLPVAGTFTPPNSPEKEAWYWFEKAAADRHFNTSTRDYLLFVTEDDTQQEKYPLPGQLRTEYPNDHFAYMLFWLGMAFTLIVVYILSHLSHEPPKEQDKT
jgi:surfeit locus 1 family protein|tara:strand:+ start:2963 stop:3679 length:717 start_codon:yes stop_codon:yes gene_type:complete